MKKWPIHLPARMASWCVVSVRLGHAKLQITLDKYSHVMQGMQAQAVAVFADAIGGF